MIEVRWVSDSHGLMQLEHRTRQFCVDASGAFCNVTEWSEWQAVPTVPLFRDQPPPALTGSEREPLAWGVLPGDGQPLWVCRSREQAQAVCILLGEQRPGTDPQVVPLVDGRDPAPQPTLTEEERHVLREVRDIYAAQGDVSCDGIAFVIIALLARLGGDA